MQIIGKCLKPAEFKKYIKNKFFGYLPANKIILHHTYRPNLTQWKGKDTIYRLKKYYESKGWKAGPHLYIAPEGIWLFTDLKKDGIHAGRKGNWRSIGIEIVGNYQKEKPSGLLWNYVLYVITALNYRLKLKTEDIKFHRDYMATACPGIAITKSWAINELKEYKKIYTLNFALVKDKNTSKKTVFFVRNNIKYPILDWETFIFYWGNKKIILLSSFQINQLKTGSVLPSIKHLI